MSKTYYLEHNAAYLIEGYLQKRKEDATKEEFERARQELLSHLKKSIETANSMSFEKFKKIEP